MINVEDYDVHLLLFSHLRCENEPESSKTNVIHSTEHNTI